MLRSHCKTMTRPVVVAAVLIVLFFASSAHAGVEDAAAVVMRLHDTLLSVMKEADALGVKGRYRRLAAAAQVGQVAADGLVIGAAILVAHALPADALALDDDLNGVHAKDLPVPMQGH